MKKLIVILICIVVVLCSNCSKKPIHKVQLGYLTSNFNTPYFINGKLKEYTQVSYYAELKNGIVVKGEQIKNSKAFNNPSTRHATFYFDKKGSMGKTIFYDDEGNPSTFAYYNYEDGRLSKVLFKLGEIITDYHDMIYEGDKIKEIVIHNSDDYIIGRYVYEYNDDGFITKETYLNNSGKQNFSREFERMKNGNWKIQSYKNSLDKFVRQSENNYDENNNLISTDIKILNGQSVNINGKKMFEYDRNGNWTKLIRYRDEIPFNITERSYVYY